MSAAQRCEECLMQCLVVADARESPPTSRSAVTASCMVAFHLPSGSTTFLTADFSRSCALPAGGRLCKSDTGGASEAEWSDDVRLTHTSRHTRHTLQHTQTHNTHKHARTHSRKSNTHTRAHTNTHLRARHVHGSQAPRKDVIAKHRSDHRQQIIHALSWRQRWRR
jgi:hypothetical protein